MESEAESPGTASTARVLVLAANRPSRREVLAHQEKLFGLLGDELGIEFETVIGDDPKNKDIRMQLFGISGRRGVYPQVFLIHTGSDDRTTTYEFYGDWVKVKAAQDMGALKVELTAVEDTPMMEMTTQQGNDPPPVQVEQQQQQQQQQQQTPYQTDTTTADVPQQQEQQHHQQQQSEQNQQQNNSPPVLVLAASRPSQQRVISQQKKLFELLDSMEISYQTLYGDDPANIRERMELFAISGRRGIYPQVFLLQNNNNDNDDNAQTTTPTNEYGGIVEKQQHSDTVFFGDWIRVNTSYEAGTLREQLLPRSSSAAEDDYGYGYEPQEPQQQQQEDYGYEPQEPQQEDYGYEDTEYQPPQQQQQQNDDEDEPSMFEQLQLARPDVVASVPAKKMEAAVKAPRKRRGSLSAMQGNYRGPFVQVVCSYHGMTPKAIKNHTTSFATLEANGIPYETLYGDSPSNKSKSEALLRISAAAVAKEAAANGNNGAAPAMPTFPQFFLMDGPSVKYFGDWSHLEASNQRGTLRQDLGIPDHVRAQSKEEQPPPPTPPNNNGNSNDYVMMTKPAPPPPPAAEEEPEEESMIAQLMRKKNESQNQNNYNQPKAIAVAAPTTTTAAVQGGGAATTTKVLVLAAARSSQQRVKAAQTKLFQILDSLEIPYVTVHGDEPQNKDIRLELFDISGRKGVYPQVFTLAQTEAEAQGYGDDDETAGTKTFFGDWVRVNASHQAGTLKDELFGGLDEAAAAAEPPSVPGGDQTTNPPAADAIPAASLPTAESTAAAVATTTKVLVLAAARSSQQRVKAAQTKLFQILDTLQIPYVTVHGDEPQNKDIRVELFDLSGRKGVYPQVFTFVQTEAEAQGYGDDAETAGTKTFFGDWVRVNASHQAGTLKDELFGSAAAAAASPSSVPGGDQTANSSAAAATAIPAPVNDNNPNVTSPTDSSPPPAEARKVLVLAAGKPSQQRVVAAQKKLFELLDSLAIPYDTVLGDEPQNKDIRLELFGISGRRGVYPQVFTVQPSDDTKVFFGDWIRVNASNQAGTLKENLLSTAAPSSSAPDYGYGDGPAASAAAVPADYGYGAPDTHTTSSAQNEPAVAMASSSLKAPTKRRGSLSAMTGNYRGPFVQVICSHHNMTREAIKHHMGAFSILESNGIPYENLYGDSQANKTKCEAFFRMSGMPNVYPQLFMIDGPSAKFFGDWDRLQESNKNGTLREDLGIPDNVRAQSKNSPEDNEGNAKPESREEEQLRKLGPKAAMEISAAHESSRNLELSHSTLDHSVNDLAQSPRKLNQSVDKINHNVADHLSIQPEEEPESDMLAMLKKKSEAAAAVSTSNSGPQTNASESVAPPSTGSQTVLVLAANRPTRREVIQYQKKLFELLDSLKLQYETIHGDEPKSKDIRMELFGISGRRGVYPQVFTVSGDGTKTFFGDWAHVHSCNQAGTLLDDLLGSGAAGTSTAQAPTTNEQQNATNNENQQYTPPPSPKPTPHDNSILVTPPPKRRGTLSNMTMQYYGPHVMALCAHNRMAKEVVRNHLRCFTILETNGIPYETIYGDNPRNQQLCAQYFELSGNSEVFPQFFVIDGASTTYFGDWNRLEAVNSLGTMRQELGIPMHVVAPMPSPMNESTPSSAGHGFSANGSNLPPPPPLSPRASPIQSHKTFLTLRSIAAESKLVLLLASQHPSQESASHQRNIFSFIEMNQIPYETIYGDDIKNEHIKDELIVISGLPDKYPQLFKAGNGTVNFVGEWDTLKDSYESGTLKSQLGFSSSTTFQTNQLSPSSGEKEKASFQLQFSPPSSPVKQDSSRSLQEPPPKRRGTLSDMAENYQGPWVLAVCSHRNLTKVDIKRHLNCFSTLESSFIPFETLYGDNPANKERCEEYFEISGRPNVYPQFFVIDGSTTTFFGDWNEIDASNSRGTLRKDMGIPDEVKAPAKSSSSPSVDHEQEKLRKLGPKAVEEILAAHSSSRRLQINLEDDSNRNLSENNSMNKDGSQGFLEVLDHSESHLQNVEAVPSAADKDDQSGSLDGALSEEENNADGNGKDEKAFLEESKTIESPGIGPRLVVWTNKESAKEEVLAHQKEAVYILKDYHIRFETIDRNEDTSVEVQRQMFKLTQNPENPAQVLEFPQFFLVYPGDLIFHYGDWAKFDSGAKSGKLAKDLSYLIETNDHEKFYGYGEDISSDMAPDAASPAPTTEASVDDQEKKASIPSPETADKNLKTSNSTEASPFTTETVAQEVSSTEVAVSEEKGNNNSAEVKTEAAKEDSSHSSDSDRPRGFDEYPKGGSEGEVKQGCACVIM